MEPEKVKTVLHHARTDPAVSVAVIGEVEAILSAALSPQAVHPVGAVLVLPAKASVYKAQPVDGGVNVIEACVAGVVGTA